MKAHIKVEEFPVVWDFLCLMRFYCCSCFHSHWAIMCHSGYIRQQVVVYTSPGNPGKGLLYGATFKNHPLMYLIKIMATFDGVRHSLRAWGLCWWCWWFVCLFHQMRTVSLQRCSELLPNPQDQDHLTEVRGEFWLVAESGLVISVAPWESASRSSLRQQLPPGPLSRVDCTSRSSSPAFSVYEGLGSASLCVPPKLFLT